LVWITYSPIADCSKLYYDISDKTVQLFLLYAPLLYVVALPSALIIAEKSPAKGLRRLMVVSTGLVLATCIVRLLPMWLGADSTSVWSVAGAHAGQIFGGLAGPFVMASPTKLSMTWFPEHERATATSIAVIANNLGSMLGFFAPFLVNPSSKPHECLHPQNVTRLLNVHLVLGIVLAIAVVVYFPSVPPTPPSVAALEQISRSVVNDTASDSASNNGVCDQLEPKLPITSDGTSTLLARPHSAGAFMANLRATLANGNFVVLAIASGSFQGILAAYAAMFSTNLPFNDVTSGWVGFGATGSLVVFAIVSGFFVDRYAAIGRRLKAGNVLLGFLTMGGYLLVCFALPLFHASAEPVIHMSDASLITLIIVSTGFIGAALPFSYELGVELTYPLPEIFSSGMISLFANVGNFVYILAMQGVSPAYATFIFWCLLAAFTLAMVPLREEYRRADSERSGDVLTSNLPCSASHVDLVSAKI
jgi:hypothetical protein